MTTIKDLIATLQKFDPSDSVEIKFNKLRVTTEIYRGLKDYEDIGI